MRSAGNGKKNPKSHIIIHRQLADLFQTFLFFVPLRVPNGPSKTGLDQLVWSKEKSSPMVEIRPTGWSGLADLTWSELVGPSPPSYWICTVL